MKFILWLGKLAISALLVTTLTVFVTWTAVQTYMNRLLDHYQLGQGMQQIEFSDFLANLTKPLNIMEQPVSEGGAGDRAANGTGENAQTVTMEGQTGGSKENGTPGAALEVLPGSSAKSGNNEQESTESSNAGGTPSTAPAGGQSTPRGDGALPVWSQSGGSGSASGRSTGGDAMKELVVSSDEFQKTKDNMSNEDKMKLFSLFVSKLPANELQTISALVEDGITKEELAEINRIVEKNLSPEEYKQMVAILEKY